MARGPFDSGKVGHFKSHELLQSRSFPSTLFRSRNKHEQKDDEEKDAGNPQSLHSPVRDKNASRACSHSKGKDDAEIMERTMKESFLAGAFVMDKSLNPASQVTNAHGTGVLVRVHLAEGLNLHGTGKRNQGVGQKVQTGREIANQKKQ